MSEDMLNALYIAPSRFHMINIISTDVKITSDFRNLYDALLTKIRNQKIKDRLKI